MSHPLLTPTPPRKKSSNIGAWIAGSILVIAVFTLVVLAIKKFETQATAEPVPASAKTQFIKVIDDMPTNTGQSLYKFKDGDVTCYVSRNSELVLSCLEVK